MTEQSDTGLRDNGDSAERMLNYVFDAGAYSSGNIWLGSEYGRVEILLSTDQKAQLQIHLKTDARNAAKAVKETDVVTSFSANGKQFNLAAWHTKQGYTLEQQPAWMHIRLEVPASASYAITATAEHGGVGIHRLTLKHCKLEGSVGLKVKGQQGYVGGHDLDQVSLDGDLEAHALDMPITGTLRVISSGRVMARTDRGHIQLSFASDPQVGFDAFGGTNKGKVNLNLALASSMEITSGQFVTARQVRSQGYSNKPVRIEVKATTLDGDITITNTEKE
ncbi:MAG: hypothetical protein MOB07_03185 [Acidobacteria bacterium]|nr:hypothetical protein [Acidobacteriota bacterium]